ncbi:aldose epimerase family protein [Paraburkholderia aspalathi]|uniref:Aldose 1-epimerase n=1 Tax=Paraburkholderia aspalathi TaxID=1324617 RepID=A0A1I6YF57_9BURK|nr:hypothetical protein [Paraburkholderia aspalathi]SFT49149.1 aldose 1-epimerase [Paraburkholderia aspalathi]
MTESSRLLLSNGTLQAEIAPHLGARMCRLQALDGDIDLVMPLGEWRAPEHDWPKAGAYPLIPYSNRIAGSCLAFGGEIHTLTPHPLDLPNALHGHAQSCAWQVLAHDSQHAKMALRERACGHWPWPFEAGLSFALRANALDVSFTLRNEGDSPMPAGLGWHPFLAIDADSTLRFDALKRWELDATFLPTGRTQRNPQSTSLTRGDCETSNLAIYASEWDGTAMLERRRGTLLITAAAPFTHLVAFAPRGAPYFCVEPVTHVANGFNLAARGIEGTGLKVLAPGEVFAAQLTLAWEPNR